MIKKISLQLLIVFTLNILIVNVQIFAANPVSKYFSGINSFRVSFTQKSYELERAPARVSKGFLVVQQPDKFYLEYSEPDKLIYVADGAKLWAFDEDLEQVIVKSQANILINTPAMILSQPQDIEKKYNVIDLGVEFKMNKFKLIPKQKDTSFEFIIIGFVDGNLKLMEMTDNFGQQTQLRFDKIEKNPTLKSNRFIFIPPKGVDVITDDVPS